MEQDRLQRRRTAQAARRRTVVRRRIAAIAVLVLAAVTVVVVLITSSSGSPSSRPNGGAPLTDGGSGQGAVSHHSHRARSSTHGGSTAAALGPATGKPGTASVPILMYHVIAPPPAGAPYPGLYVEPQEFAAQMQALRSAGWHPVTLDQLLASWTHGARLPPGRPIVLTFDNGYHSQYSQALPVLKRLGWVADENIQLAGLPPSQGGLTDPEVRALIAAGWELDTQGISHADLITLDASQLHYQVATARQILRHRYGVPVNWFCYPSGHYNATVIAAVRAAGFIGSTTVVPGWASRSTDMYTLPRLRVLGGTSPSQLLAEISSIRTDGPPPASYGSG
jgi:peptidoglycan/xylan/chitin deacetylase (PgdA/CDA1 family)